MGRSMYWGRSLYAVCCFRLGVLLSVGCGAVGAEGAFGASGDVLTTCEM